MFNSALAQQEQDVTRIVPAADIKETPVSFILRVELPGVAKEDMKVTLEKSTLTITGACVPHFSERSEKTLEYRREFSLGENIDNEKIEAAYSAGVLTLTLAKKKEAASKEIHIN